MVPRIRQTHRKCVFENSPLEISFLLIPEGEFFIINNYYLITMNKEQQKSQVALAEEKVLAFWKEKNIFQKSLKKNEGNKEFVFFDGPPYATGLPHYGHLLPGTIKDVIPRYKTMRGLYVPRQWGWDCHGLPIENLIQKELNLATKQDVVEYGIEKFNKAARDSVLRYEKDWKESVPRVGRFVDMENPYKTMDLEYMESVWAVFKNLQEKGLVYRGYKSMMVSPPLETVLSNQEVNMGGYKDIKDISVYANFTLTSGSYKGANMIAWTTTPWTLPGNVLLAVGQEIEYSIVSCENSKYVVASSLVETNFADKEYLVEKQILGKDLIGAIYEPVFPMYKDHANAFRVVHGDFVTTTDGTGIVHIAPGFGQDDLEIGQKEKVEPIQHVNMNGHFVLEVESFLVEAGYDVKGWAVRNTENHQHVDIEIVKYLARNEKLFAKKKYTHSYPVCWRTDCPLINYATESWFVNVQKIKNKLIKNNQKTNWVPSHIKDGRFGKWLEEVRDWSVSRARFWGTPLPVWQSSDGENLFIGSVEELRKYSSDAITKIIFVRHGQAEHNVLNMSSSALDKHPLTDLGEKQAAAAAQKLLKENVDVVYTSPVLRARQTAEFFTKKANMEMRIDDRLIEITSGKWEETTQNDPRVKAERDAYKNLPIQERYVFKRGKTGESWEDLDIRTESFIKDIIVKHPGKTIAVFSHQGTGSSMLKYLKDLSNEETVDRVFHNRAITGNAVPVTIYVDTKRTRELDLHRPYIDGISIEKNDKKFNRVEDVFDVWFDSGSMPYASHHYPFDDSRFQPKKTFFGKTKRFPADFVAEGQDQTRGWFYVMMVLATAQFDQNAFKNVIVNGLVLAEDGKKMSKRLKNYPDMTDIINTEGADALRLFLMASPAVHAEDLNFTKKTVSEIQSKVMGRLRNSVNFYKMYSSNEEASADSINVLDLWIISRLYETNTAISESLDVYMIDKASRPLFDFVGDLSTWYVRRSRDRFKGDGEDKKNALSTMRFVLKEFAKISAPFVPFVAEEVYQIVKEDSDLESVHLCDWVEAGSVNKHVLSYMQKTQELCSAALEARQKSGVKVRQPLASLTVSDYVPQEYQEIILEEVNVKNIVFGETLALDTNLTDELKLEGLYRDVLRIIQDLRKRKDLKPEDSIKVVVSKNLTKVVGVFGADLKQKAGVSDITYSDTHTEEELYSIENQKFGISINFV